MNVVMKLQVPYNAGNVACFLPGRAKDLSAPLIWPYMDLLVVFLMNTLYV